MILGLGVIGWFRFNFLFLSHLAKIICIEFILFFILFICPFGASSSSFSLLLTFIVVIIRFSVVNAVAISFGKDGSVCFTDLIVADDAILGLNHSKDWQCA